MFQLIKWLINLQDGRINYEEFVTMMRKGNEANPKKRRDVFVWFCAYLIVCVVVVVVMKNWQNEKWFQLMGGEGKSYIFDSYFNYLYIKSTYKRIHVVWFIFMDTFLMYIFRKLDWEGINGCSRWLNMKKKKTKIGSSSLQLINTLIVICSFHLLSRRFQQEIKGVSLIGLLILISCLGDLKKKGVLFFFYVLINFSLICTFRSTW